MLLTDNDGTMVPERSKRDEPLIRRSVYASEEEQNEKIPEAHKSAKAIYQALNENDKEDRVFVISGSPKNILKGIYGGSRFRGKNLSRLIGSYGTEFIITELDKKEAYNKALENLKDTLETVVKDFCKENPELELGNRIKGSSGYAENKPNAIFMQEKDLNFVIKMRNLMDCYQLENPEEKKVELINRLDAALDRYNETAGENLQIKAIKGANTYDVVPEAVDKGAVLTKLNKQYFKNEQDNPPTLIIAGNDNSDIEAMKAADHLSLRFHPVIVGNRVQFESIQKSNPETLHISSPAAFRGILATRSSEMASSQTKRQLF